VSASVVNTTLLVPFLLSMGGWIEVIEPKDVREELTKRVTAMSAHYVA
jgi:predicted DNA-binding transcriptional regulator YafY